LQPRNETRAAKASAVIYGKKQDVYSQARELITA